MKETVQWESKVNKDKMTKEKENGESAQDHGNKFADDLTSIFLVHAQM